MEEKAYQKVGIGLVDMICPRTIGCTFKDEHMVVSVQTNNAITRSGMRLYADVEHKLKITIEKNMNNGEFGVNLQPASPMPISLRVNSKGLFEVKGSKTIGCWCGTARYDSDKMDYDAYLVNTKKMNPYVFNTQVGLVNKQFVTAAEVTSPDIKARVGYSFGTGTLDVSAFWKLSSKLALLRL